MADAAGVVLKDAPATPQVKQPESKPVVGIARIAADPSLPRAVVTRVMNSERVYEPGEVIEVPGRRREVLIRARMMREFAYGEQIYRCACGRLWVDEEKAKHHCGN